MARTALTHVALAILASGPLLAQSDPSGGGGPGFPNLLQLLHTPVITATRTEERLADAPATVLVLTRQDLEARGYRELTDLFQDLPGFDVTLFYGDTYFKPYARGFRNTIGESFVVMRDGMPFNHLWFNDVAGFVVPCPLSSIDRVEVVYGPASALYGANAFNGVINVITRKDAEANGVSGSAQAWAGSFGNQAGDFEVMLKREDLRFSVTGRFDEGDIDERASGKYEWLSEKYLQNRTIYGRMLDYHTDRVGRLTSPIHTRALDLRLSKGQLEAGFTFSKLSTGYGLVYATDGFQPGLSVWSVPEYSAFIRWRSEVAPTLSMTSLARWRRDEVAPETQDDEVYFGSLDLSSPNDTQAFYYQPLTWRVLVGENSFNQDWSWTGLPRLTVNAGFTLASQSQQTSYLHSTYPGAPGGYILTADYQPGFMQAPVGTTLSDLSHVFISKHGLYAQGQYRLAASQSLIAGVRSDWSTTFGGASTLRGGYVGNFGGWGAKLLYGQGYNEPSWRLLGGGWSKSGSNTHLRPERSNTVEASLSYTESTWSLLADAYRVRSSSVVINLPASQGGAQNAGNYDILGLDLHGQFLLPWFEECKVWGYVTHLFKAEMSPFAYQLSRFAPYTDLTGPQQAAMATDQGTYDIGDIARTKVNLGTTAQFTRAFGMTLLGRYVSARPTVASNPAKEIGGFFVADLVGTWKLGRGLALQARVRNLLDKDYFTPGNRGGDAGFTPAVDASGQVLYDANGNYVGPRGAYTSVIPQFSRNVDVSLRWRF